MPSITMDGHTFSVDGRRLWVVGGAVHYTQTPRSLWGARIRAAREAGLNTIEVPVVWSAHEPRQGKFTFEGDLDLAAFIREIDKAGLQAIVRIGPCVGEGLDLGGMPAWLPGVCEGKLRSHAPSYLGPTSAFISAVCEKIVNLQVTGGPNRRGKGPIIAVCAEHRWLCGDDGVISLATNTGGVLKEGTDYLRELARFLREGGINVPVIANNDLYHASEGQVEVWTGLSHLHANLRQLRTQRPGQPKLVMGLRGAHEKGGFDTWGGGWCPGPSARRTITAVAEVLAAGGQFCLPSFAQGTRLGFFGGRLGDGPDRFVTPATSGSAISESGARGELYNALKRVGTFASSFERVFCGLDPTYQPVTIAADAVGPGASATGRKAGQQPSSPASVVHCTGSQGSLVFVFAPGDGRRVVKLVLGDGSTLPVTLGDQDAGWVLLDTHLAGRATLDYCNVNAFALVGKSLVCYGPAGAPALISINGSPVDLLIPEGDRPLIQEIEGVALALCSEACIDRAIATPEGVWFGVQSLDSDGAPVPCEGQSQAIRLGADGSVRSASVKAPSRASHKLALTNLSWADCSAYTSGESPRFARIDRPATQESLGTPYGYGWMRARLRSGKARKARAAIFESADRVHVWAGGEALGVIGSGPGATPACEPFSVSLAKGDTTMGFLFDNLGRASEGSLLGEPKGLYGHVWEVSPIRAGAPTIETDAPMEPLKYRTPIMGLQIGDTTDPRRLTWTFKHSRKTPVFVCLEASGDHGVQSPGLLLLNGAPVSLAVPGTPIRLRLDGEQLKGTNKLQIAIVGDMEHAAPAYKGSMTLFLGEECLSEKGDWGFAKWEPPQGGPAAWQSVKKGEGPRKQSGPTWWRAEFSLPENPGPVALDTSGLSKGQLYVNGHNVGRYFTATARGKAVGPQTRLYIPDPWLKAGGLNEVLIFDEHGFTPAGCRVVSA